MTELLEAEAENNEVQVVGDEPTTSIEPAPDEAPAEPESTIEGEASAVVEAQADAVDIPSPALNSTPEQPGETLASDEVLCEWIERLEIELANRDATINNIRSALLEPLSIRDANAAQRDCEHQSPAAAAVAAVAVLNRTTPCDHGYPASGCHPHVSEHFRRIESLENEIANRDETINALRTQAADHEAKLVAQRSEWEDLHLWVEQVEQRIEQSGYYDVIFSDDLSMSQTPGGAFNGPRRENAQPGWESERAALVRELEKAKEALQAHQKEAAEQTELFEREREELLDIIHNQREENHNFKLEYEHLLKEYENQHHRFQEVIDPLRLELEASRHRERELTMLREAKAEVAVKANPLESDERIRAFRQHLDQIHANESATKPQRGKLLGMKWFRNNR